MTVPTGKNTTKKASSAKRTSSTKKPSSAYRSSSRSTAKSRTDGKRSTTKRSKATVSRKGRQSRHSSQWLLTAAVAAILIIFFWYMCVQPLFGHYTFSNPDAPYCVDIPAGFAVNGIDISHHQGDINWELLGTTRLADTPLSFIFIKATEGGDHKDNLFDSNFAQAAESGFIRGAYHFYNPATDPIRQADFFISTVTLTAGDLPPVIDIEVKPSRQQLSVFYAQLSTFLYRLEAHYGVAPIIYTSYKYKERYLSESLFDRFPLWIAHYHVDKLEYKGNWAFWQHTDRAVIPGIPEKTDLNVFNGTLRDLQKLTIQK